jgi:hypothetical protein
MKMPARDGYGTCEGLRNEVLFSVRRLSDDCPATVRQLFKKNIQELRVLSQSLIV